MRIAIAKIAFNTKIPLLTSKIEIELRKKGEFYIWNVAFHVSEIWTPRKLERKYLGSFENGVGGEWRR